MKVKAIAAVSLNGVFGNKDTNKLPWAKIYLEDLKFFRNTTINSTIIFGRHTFESINSKPLPKRRNILISSKPANVEGVETFSSLEEAIKNCENDVWLIGGLGIYSEGLKFVEEIYLTSIPEIVNGNNLIYFPYLNPDYFTLSESIKIGTKQGLICNIYRKSKV